MKVLLIGSGGREHSIALKLSQSPLLTELFIAPGNAGTAKLGTNLDIKDSDIDGLLNFAKENAIDLTFVGPEAPLVLGIVDDFEAEGLSIVGPNKIGAQLEGSKQWAKEKMKKYGIPTAAFETFTDYESSLSYIKSRNTFPIVIKADGLAAGKGVTVAENYEMAENALKDCFLDKKFSDAGAKVVIEDFLKGEEASIFAFTDGKTILPMVPAQDHKAVFDGDKGPNTGGMGAYSPAPIATQAVQDKVLKSVFQALIQGFNNDGINYKGIVYAGLMIDNDDVSIVEFNARFGDPETQIVLPRLKNDLLEVLIAISKGTLADIELEWHDTATVCVVMASEGYPESYEKGKVITGITDAEAIEGVSVVHAGTKQDGDSLVSNGGRVLAVVAEGSDIKSAIDTAYKGVEKVTFEGAYNRTDIGFKALR
jgi:phosphoribosylamine--glycine ligase